MNSIKQLNMESIGIKLTDEEQKLFDDFFNKIDEENVGKISFKKAINFLNSSQLSSDVIDKVNIKYLIYLFN